MYMVLQGHNLHKAMELLTSDYIFPLKKEKAAIILTENRIQRMDLINITLPRVCINRCPITQCRLYRCTSHTFSPPGVAYTKCLSQKPNALDKSWL